MNYRISKKDYAAGRRCSGLVYLDEKDLTGCRFMKQGCRQCRGSLARKAFALTQRTGISSGFRGIILRKQKNKISEEKES